MDGGFTLRLGDEDSALVLVFRRMAVNAVVAGVEFAADEPFPEGGLLVSSVLLQGLSQSRREA